MSCAVLGNPISITAYKAGNLPFPDGAVLAKLAWKHVPSTEFEAASLAGAATTLQIMVKDPKKYTATGACQTHTFVCLPQT
jgi:hypothetical protein